MLVIMFPIRVPEMPICLQQNDAFSIIVFFTIIVQTSVSYNCSIA